MSPGEYAVHYSGFEDTIKTGPYCTILGSLPEAVAYAEQQVRERPTLRCTIYDHQGLIGPPLRDIRGNEFKGLNELSARFRRWTGSILFFGGLILMILDWSHDFQLSWPALIGSRMLIPGLLLLVTEAIVFLYARRNRRRGAATERA